MELNIEDILKDFIDLDLLSSKAQRQNEMRKEMKFCDITLKINDKDLFKVHKNIIASSCTYFSGLFNGDWLETREDVILLDYEITPECFEIILEYMYTGKICFSIISFENALSIHKAAGFYNLLKLKQIMSKILEKFITEKTLFSLWRHGVNFFDNSLKDKCIEIISKNPKKFLEANLLELTFMELELLCKEKKLIYSVEEIYKNLIDWVKSDFESREKYLKDLLTLIDFTKISGEFMQSKILNDKILYKNEYFVEKIMGELSNCFNVNSKNTIAKTTEDKSKKLTILLFSETGIFKIDLESKICLRLLSHKKNKCNFSITNYGFNNILICGGNNDSNGFTNICEYYCPNKNSIREFPPMLEKRRLHRVFSCGDQIYAFGGFKNDTMEIFDINTGTWNYGPKMPRDRWYFALEEYNGVIYLIGGYSSDHNSVHATNAIHIDKFNIENNKWDSCKDILMPIHKSIAVDRTAYLFHLNSKSFIKYDLITESITHKQYFTDDQINLNLLEVVKVHNNILILGKYRGDFCSAIYDMQKNKMEQIHIDISQCGDIGEWYQLKIAFL